MRPTSFTLLPRPLFRYAAAIAAALTVAACAAEAPTAPATSMEATARRHAPPPTAGGWVLTVTGTLADGGTFTGEFLLQSFSVDDARTLIATGTLTGTATSITGVVTQISQSVSAPATLARENRNGNPNATAAVAADAITPMAADDPGVCDILFLDLGPLNLNILGLVVDLAPIVLDVDAVPGGGNLLGNLLCAVVGLLDGAAIVGAISNLLNVINGILAGL